MPCAGPDSAPSWPGGKRGQRAAGTGTELLKLQGGGNEASKGWGGFSSMQTLSSWDTVPAPHT